MKNVLVFCSVILVLILSSCSKEEERWLTENNTKLDLIETLGYKQIFSNDIMAICNQATQTQGSNVLGIDCDDIENHKHVIVVGSNDTPSNILLVPEFKAEEIISFDYPFPDWDDVVDVINLYNESLDAEDLNRCNLHANLLQVRPFEYPSQVSFYGALVPEFPLYLSVGDSEINSTAFSFVVTLHQDNVSRLYYISDLDPLYYELIHEFH